MVNLPLLSAVLSRWNQFADISDRRNGRIIALLTLAGCLLLGFIACQILKPKTATIAPRIFCQRSIMAGFWSTFCVGSSMMIMVYYLPIYFVSGRNFFRDPLKNRFMLVC